MKDFNLLGVDELSQDSYFRKWVLGELHPDDHFWEMWLLSNPAKKQLVDEAKSLVIALQAVEKDVFREEEIRQGIRRILVDTEAQPKRFTLSSAWWLRLAALVIIVLGLGWWTWERRFVSETTSSKATPAQQQTIHRNDGTTSTTFILADGSKITLGPKSELRYNTEYGKNTREVNLTGEAFFDVAKDAKRPFLVNTGKLVTKVIGTSFRVKAYEVDAEISVSVKTGKVMVLKQLSESPKENALSTELVLAPNQKAVFNKEKELLIKTLVEKPLQINALPVSTDFVFEETKVADAYSVLEKYYGVKITYDTELMSHCTVTADLREEESLYQKLDLICEIIQAEYKITDGQIVIYGAGCPKN